MVAADIFSEDYKLSHSQLIKVDVNLSQFPNPLHRNQDSLGDYYAYLRSNQPIRDP
jgi:hypothetical protein